ncbi:hypothetical protein B0H12DRAFT_990236, partial [Mycena haematopus]
KPAPITVTADSLKKVFEKRLNPPNVLPNQFDSPQHGINKILAALLPNKTEDQTSEGFFSKNWGDHDMGRLKDHLRKNLLESATGEDQTLYADMIGIPNDDLAALY